MLHPSAANASVWTLSNLNAFLSSRHGTLQEAFQSFDVQKSGLLSQEQFVAALRRLNFPGDAEAAFFALCPEGATSIPLEDFVRAMKRERGDLVSSKTEAVEDSNCPLEQTARSSDSGNGLVNEFSVRSGSRRDGSESPDTRHSATGLINSSRSDSGLVMRSEIAELRQSLWKLQSDRQAQHGALLEALQNHKEGKNLDSVVRREVDKAVASMTSRVEVELSQLRKALTGKVGNVSSNSSEMGSHDTPELELKVERIRLALEDRVGQLAGKHEEIGALAKKAYDLSNALNQECARAIRQANRGIHELKDQVKGQGVRLDDMWKHITAENRRNEALSKSLQVRVEGVLSKIDNTLMEEPRIGGQGVVTKLDEKAISSLSASHDRAVKSKSLLHASASTHSQPRTPRLSPSPVRGATIEISKTPMGGSSVEIAAAADLPQRLRLQRDNNDPAASVVDMIQSLRQEVLSLHDTDMEICEQALKVGVGPVAQAGLPLAAPRIAEQSQIAAQATPLSQSRGTTPRSSFVPAVNCSEAMAMNNEREHSSPPRSQRSLSARNTLPFKIPLDGANGLSLRPASPRGYSARMTVGGTIGETTGQPFRQSSKSAQHGLVPTRNASNNEPLVSRTPAGSELQSGSLTAPIAKVIPAPQGQQSLPGAMSPGSRHQRRGAC